MQNDSPFVPPENIIFQFTPHSDLNFWTGGGSIIVPHRSWKCQENDQNNRYHITYEMTTMVHTSTARIL
ncbi:hypothetical protein Mpal_0876 [Methanosphaerula palustris E1-9c]|uniref:Uncharacterized protein n=1 Tax=Methanosphaerula palustris (strain ATCC BAA-1556 / DSM 19958 / E1-9c) TaxID=521011 RepID=B8GGH9_METPE|nr:hypothetical protein Mpal_0876 [Methanosphaerula palustris E1-9c]